MAAGDSPQAAVREEEVKDAQDTVKYSAGFSQEEVEAAETAAAAVKEVLALSRAEAAVVPSWAAGAVPLWTYLQ